MHIRALDGADRTKLQSGQAGNGRSEVLDTVQVLALKSRKQRERNQLVTEPSE
ncbi:hypothetical protein [[Kitasatospora] papulosa]|uniref:hypothetical protein n=1 Tax=[Kitasatospora] papulosa TaxID=1464011 RepID=UPI0036A14CE3